MNQNKNIKPYIKVIYEDVKENLTQQNIRKVKTYFEQTYKSKSVKVIPIPTKVNTNLVVEFNNNENITDSNFQKDIIKTYLKQNDIDVDWVMLNRLDNRVNEKLLETDKNKIKYNSWQLRKIEFSNLLSFGDDNYLDYSKLDGITNVESLPKNFGGKTTLFCDVIMFLFFNKTTKTKTNSELFNLFTNKDEIFVKGEISIDNEIYIIERLVKRKLKRSGDYDITSKLEFFKIDENNVVKNLNDEQRRKTETLITSAIGDEEDFLLTILTTGNNLEDLIESKPTARGNILTKFIGLEILKKKEEIARQIYNEWNKKLISNNFDINSLKKENENFILLENENIIKIIELQNNYKIIENNLNKLELENEDLFKKRKNVDETELLNFNYDNTIGEIKLLEFKLSDLKNNLLKINVQEPKTYYLESDSEKLNNDFNKINIEISRLEDSIKHQLKLINDLEHSKICPTCKREFEGNNNDVEIEKAKLLINNFELNLKELKLKLDGLTIRKNELNILKNELDLYEKNKLIKLKKELEIEQINNSIEKFNLNIQKYEINKSNIEENKKIDLNIQTNKSLIQSKKGELKITTETLERLKQNIENNKIKYNQNDEYINKINQELELSKIFQVYLSVFGKNGISKLILKNIIPKINEDLLELLIDSCNFTVELLVNDKNEVEFNMIDNETRISKSLSSGSGYEKTIASLALRAVLTKISTLPKPNVMIMDEIFGKVANENLDLIGEFFIKIKNYFQHIIVISHNPLIKNWSDNNILIIKENNISKIN